MIDHVSILVNDLTESKIFYEKAFVPFGFVVTFGENDKFWAFNIGNGALFEILQHETNDKLTHCHIAFRANSKEQVNNFYEAALEAGAKCNGAPGPRPQYTEGYYAAFILDPSGHNIEAVYDPNTIATEK